jgi:hypothetical protein
MLVNELRTAATGEGGVVRLGIRGQPSERRRRLPLSVTAHTGALNLRILTLVN